MKFNCGPSPETKRKRKAELAAAEHKRLINWHSFFAIWPRRVASARTTADGWNESNAKVSEH